MSARALAALLVLAIPLASFAAEAQPLACKAAPSDSVGKPTDVLARLVGLASVAPTQSDQRGLGGTGVIARGEERGLGGTGIVGVVTGFASICVNGYEVHVEDASAITVENIPATSADVRLGQLVRVEAYPTDHGLVATKVSVQVAVAGPVSALAEDQSSMTVAGQIVEIAGFNGSADVSKVRAGDWVMVSGLRRDDDVIVGTSITVLPTAGREVVVSGQLRAGVDGRLRLGNLAVEAAYLAAGQSVVISGNATGEKLVAREARVEVTSPFSAAVRTLSVQAYGDRLNEELSRISGAPVRLSGAALLERNAILPLQAEGRIAPSGLFAADRVMAPSLPQNGLSPTQPSLGTTVVPATPTPTKSDETRGTSQTAPVAGPIVKPPIMTKPDTAPRSTTLPPRTGTGTPGADRPTVTSPTGSRPQLPDRPDAGRFPGERPQRPDMGPPAPRP